MVQEPGAEASARTLERKRDILRAASEVFRQRGFHAAGMREIAAQAGMHAGNLYYYFANKQELLAFCQEDSLGQLLATAETIAAGSDPPAEQLRRLVVEHVRILNEAIPGSLAHLEVEALEEPWRQRIQERRDEYESILRGVIERGVRRGSFREIDPKVATLALLGAVNWTVKWFQPDGGRSASAIGEDFADLLVDGLGSRA
jgi:AcrR family transcriptional regulator